jgi:hypothetical protein
VGEKTSNLPDRNSDNENRAAREFEIEELEAILELPADHPRRRRLETDPRFRAAVHAYLQFLSLGQAEPDREAARAEEKLGKVLEHEIFGPSDSTAASAIDTRSRIRRMWQLPWLRPTAAVALLIVAAVGFSSLLRSDGPGDAPSGVLRIEQAAPQAEVHLDMATTGRTSDGSVQVAWQAYPGAETYRVILYGADLAPLTELTVTNDTKLVLPLEEISRLTTDQGSLFYRVEALRGGDPVARSQPQLLPTTDD